MRALVFSDLHLEFRNNTTDFEMFKSKFRVPKVDVVINAGDTHPSGLMREYFKEGIPNYLEVIGNHDLYGSELKTYRWISVIEGVKICGVTLWTDFNKNNPLAKLKFQQNLADQRLIKKSDYDVPLVDCLYTIHKMDLEYIEREKPDFVVTHHAPSFRSVHPRFYHSGDLNYCFYSDLDNFILDHPNIKYWIHGHVHDPFDYTIGGCRVVCNPLGYPNETYQKDKYYQGVIIDV